jgi:hypothetical protein
MADIPPGERERLINLLPVLAAPGGFSDDEFRILEILRRNERPVGAIELISPLWEERGLLGKATVHRIMYRLIDRINKIFESSHQDIHGWRLRISSSNPAAPQTAFHLTVEPISPFHPSMLTIKPPPQKTPFYFPTDPPTLPAGKASNVSPTEYILSPPDKKAASPATIFICHSSPDKERVRKINADLINEGFNTWLDEDNLLPGQNWELEIRKAVRECHVALVCLTKTSITREGFVNKEIKLALDVADQKPEGTIYIIPARLEECTIPERLSHIHWVDLFKTDGFKKLCRAIRSKSP